jgi:hypothetical protein
MNHKCLYLLLILLLLLFLFTKKTCKEPFNLQCEDDPKWFTVDRTGKKNFCKDIGTSASCYDRGPAQREGWQKCLKTCGNCANVQVSKAPMNRLAMFSDDPFEKFGIVLGVDKSRKFIDEGSKETNEEKISKVVNDKFKDDFEDMIDRLESLESMFDALSSNVRKCDTSANCKAGTFKSCNKQCLNCPPKKVDTQKRIYVEQANGKIQFPALRISCDMVGRAKNVKPGNCKNHMLFETIGKNKGKKNKPISLYDVCPRQCGSECK